MVAQAGKQLLIKVGDGAGPEVFTTVAGLRSNSISINKETVDITNKGSTGQWRELLGGAGVKSVSVSGSGVFLDDASEETVRADIFSDAITNYQILVPDFGTFTGAFEVTSIEYAGEYNGEATYSLSLESAGVIAFAAV